MGDSVIELHQYPAIWGLPSLSPFCIKAEAFLRHHKIKYKVVTEKNPASGPKGKMPFIKDGLTVIADSTFILDYLFDNKIQTEHVDPYLKAQGIAFQRLLEENLYFILLFSRWIDPIGWAILKKEFTPLFPPIIGKPFLYFLRHQLKKQAHKQGIGRHSLKEIYNIGRKDIESLSNFLGAKHYFLGDARTSLDASAYAFLITILKQPIPSLLQETVLSFSNLVQYAQREERALFPEFVT